jgi:hypothetical protein
MPQRGDVSTRRELFDHREREVEVAPAVVAHEGSNTALT